MSYEAVRAPGGVSRKSMVRCSEGYGLTIRLAVVIAYFFYVIMGPAVCQAGGDAPKEKKWSARPVETGDVYESFLFSGPLADDILFYRWDESLTERLFNDRLIVAAEPGNIYPELYNDTGYVVLLAMGFAAGLYLIPEEMSGWRGDDRVLNYGALTDRYWRNVTNAPVVDQDNVYINYLGHPYVGAAYYTRARHEQHTREQALAYAFWMSTLVYEYGIEAFFEKPSYQDIVVTPIFGTILGELGLRLEGWIIAHDREVLGSEQLGAVCLFFIDPLSGVIDPVKEFLDQYVDVTVEQYYFYQAAAPPLKSCFAAVGDCFAENVQGLKLVFSLQ